MLVYLNPVCKYRQITKRKDGKGLARDLRRLTNKLSPAVQVSLTRGIRTFQDKAAYGEILDAVKAGKIKDIDKIAPWDKLTDEFKDLEPTTYNTMVAGGKKAQDFLPVVLAPELKFDVVNPRISKWIKTNTGKRIKDLTTESKKAIDDMVKASFMQGIPPRDAANTIRSSIGINERQAKALMNYQGGLVKRGIKGEDLARKLSTKKDEYLKYRTNMIARTETANALNAGHLELWNQAADEKLIDPKKSEKEWVAGPGACLDCKEMNGERVPIDEPWITPDGDPVMEPSQIHPSCNCGMEIHPEIL